MFVRIRSGNKREAGQCTGRGRWADYSVYKDKVGRPKRFFSIFSIFANDLLRKWGAKVPYRVEFDGESIGSISRARGDLQQCRRVPYVSKNVLKRKSATLKKYGGKSKNGGPIFFVECVE